MPVLKLVHYKKTCQVVLSMNTVKHAKNETSKLCGNSYSKKCRIDSMADNVSPNQHAYFVAVCILSALFAQTCLSQYKE